MSLFKARDFWSFNLSDLSQLDSESSRLIETDIEENFGDTVQDDRSILLGANFVADLGRFQAINNGQHDVLVCANLYGLILILQIPENEQKRFATDKKDDKDLQENKLDSQETSQRQLLLVTKVEHTHKNKLTSKNFASIVDIKCGYFSSTTKQSIALVTSNCELIVFQVKQQTKQTIDDLISEPNPPLSCQFSHYLEEQYRIDLIDGELAQSILVLSRHGVELSLNRPDKDQVSGSRKSICSSICLPQRDSIVVQYTNQLLFSLIDHKKVIGHYRLDTLQCDKQSQDTSMWKLAQSTGFVPAAYLHETHSLVISLTDRRVCSLPLAKLTSQAKENVVKRVAKNLLSSSLSYNNNNNKNSNDANQMIELELDKISEWQRELMQSPLQLIGLIRRQQTANNKSENSGSMQRSQLLVMSRYNLDLFSSSGEHLWCQRYETSLICCHIYTMQPNQSQLQEKTSSSFINDDQLFILVCSDCLSSDKCNLSIMLEDQIVWSALLNSKPIQLWRANAQRMSGLLLSLDAMNEQVNVSYLGTNRDEDSIDEESEADAKSDICLSQLETLDECFSSQNKEERTTSDASLSVKVNLEASNQWPNVCVKCKLSISPRRTESLGGLLQNITLLMEYDDSLQFEFQQQNSVGTRQSSIEINELQESTLQFHLGNCWPDRREPLIVEGKFSLRSCSRTLSNSEGKSMSASKLLMEQGDKLAEAPKQTKSLRVNLIFKFNEIHSNLVIQEESFLLPLSLISQLTLIDYSSGAKNATNLDDFMANLGPSYIKRPSVPINYVDKEESSRHDGLKCCDILLQFDDLDLLGLADELIEADLVCRGLDLRNRNLSGSDLSSSSQATAEQLLQQRRMSTLENINLLAQSLDCRLRFKSLARPVNYSALHRQETDVSDQQDVSMISIGLKLTSNEIIQMNNSNSVVCSLHNSMDSETLVWLHLLDLRTLIDSPDSSLILVEQFVRQHLAEWKWQKLIPIDESKSKATTIQTNDKKSILLSIESDDGLAILFMQNHLIERVRQITKKTNMIVRYQTFNSLHELQHDSIEVNLNNLLKMLPFLALNIKMHDYMKNLISWHSNEVRDRFIRLKDELAKEFYKFQITTLASLSLAKKLCNLPDEIQIQFNILSKITNQIQLNLTKLLNEMEKIKKLDRTFAKIVIAPVGCRIVLESGENNMEQLAPNSLPSILI